VGCLCAVYRERREVATRIAEVERRLQDITSAATQEVSRIGLATYQHLIKMPGYGMELTILCHLLAESFFRSRP